jgi:hypothetical protein
LNAAFVCWLSLSQENVGAVVATGRPPCAAGRVAARCWTARGQSDAILVMPSPGVDEPPSPPTFTGWFYCIDGRGCCPSFRAVERSAEPGGVLARARRRGSGKTGRAWGRQGRARRRDGCGRRQEWAGSVASCASAWHDAVQRRRGSSPTLLWCRLGSAELGLPSRPQKEGREKKDKK